MIQEFWDAAQEEVDNHSIYVWGGSGELCCEVSESWIRRKESGRMPDAAVKEWEEVMDSDFADVARCFDCSGYVSWCLKKIGLLENRTDCDGLFARCTEVYTPTNGTLLFRQNPADPNDETHVGIYFDGLQYEARGRAVGVVAMEYNPNYWQKLGWFKALKPEPQPEPPEPPEPTEKVVKVKGKSVWVRDKDGTNGKKLFVAHSREWYREHGFGKKGDEFPLLEIAPSGWYKIETKYPEAYITNKERYTSLVDE